MRRLSILVVAAALAACGDGQTDAQVIAGLQAKSALGPTSEWRLDPALALSVVQGMRDRAYRFCLSKKSSDEECTGEQDQSLFAYANSFRLVRGFRSEVEPVFPYARAHKDDPSAFGRALNYCGSIYVDQRSEDARSLGPCMSGAVGADYFGVIPVS